jgi:hypothetical protein
VTQISAIARKIDAVTMHPPLKRANIVRLAPLQPLGTPCLPEPAVTQRPILIALGRGELMSLVAETR